MQYPLSRDATQVAPYATERAEWDRYCDHLSAPMLEAVLVHPLVQRLADVSHYGLLSMFFDGVCPEVARTSRFAHSLAVGLLAFRHADRHRLSPSERGGLLLSALLHDVGHTPYSHSLESAFHDADSEGTWDHNRAAPRIAAEVLAAAGVPASTCEVTLAILRREHPLTSVLFGATGVDAVENVERTRWLLAADRGGSRAPLFAGASTLRGSAELAEFAELKTRFYRELFYEPRYQVFEMLARQVVWIDSQQLGPAVSGRAVQRPEPGTDPLALSDGDLAARHGATWRRMAAALRSVAFRDGSRSGERAYDTEREWQFRVRRRSIRLSATRRALVDRTWHTTLLADISCVLDVGVISPDVLHHARYAGHS